MGSGNFQVRQINFGGLEREIHLRGTDINQQGALETTLFPLTSLQILTDSD